MHPNFRLAVTVESNIHSSSAEGLVQCGLTPADVDVISCRSAVACVQNQQDRQLLCRNAEFAPMLQLVLPSVQVAGRSVKGDGYLDMSSVRPRCFSNCPSGNPVRQNAPSSSGIWEQCFQHSSMRMMPSPH
jgi:hypothetical protein